MSRQPNVFIPGRELIDLGMCPFADPGFDLDIDVPCPVCGALGDDPDDSKCVGNGTKPTPAGEPRE